MVFSAVVIIRNNRDVTIEGERSRRRLDTFTNYVWFNGSTDILTMTILLSLYVYRMYLEVKYY